MQLVQHLVAKGICRGGGVNVREKDAGHSPLHDCAAKGDTELLALLCKHGGDVLLRNIKGETPLHVACRVGSKEAVLLLLAPKEGRETLHLLDSASSYSPLVTALMHGHRDIVTFLLGAPPSTTPPPSQAEASGSRSTPRMPKAAPPSTTRPKGATSTR